jgi:DNA-binding SARP family transcriptional activator
MIKVPPDSATPAPLELQLLGPSKVVLNGTELHFPVKKTLALLAYLALEGSTPRGRLASLFWSDNTDEDARRNLRRELHRLRESGLRDRLSGQGEHLGLHQPTQSDVARFEAALDAGHLEVALGLYRGELLEGVALDGSSGFDEWLELRREHLNTARRRAMLELAERLETRGEWRRALDLHLDLLSEDRLQERAHREVMRLHYLLGEREAALEQFERCRNALGTELGLEPLPETLQLAERIRTARDPGATVALKPVSIGKLNAPLVGRETELAWLSVASTPLCLIVGEPGVGKSRLGAEFTHRFASALIVRFSEITAQTPLSAVAEAIRSGLNDPGMQTRLENLAAIWKHELARLVPELDPQGAPRDAPLAEGRSRFLEGLSQTVSVMAEVIVLDDLHCADGASLEWLAHLARRAAREPAATPRLIATARDQELTTNTAADQVVNALKREGLVTEVHLEPLTEHAVRALIGQLSGNPGATLFSRRLHRVTTGNPFFALETIRYLFETGDLQMDPLGGWSTRFDETTTDYAELPIPPSIRQAVLERLDRLGPAARRLLETAALTSDGFTLEEIQPATALSDWEGLEGLERAVNAQILSRQETGYGFGHDLVRSTLEQHLMPERRRLIHFKLAGSLEALGAQPARIATHLEQAGKALAAVPWRVRASDAAQRVFAYQEALAQLDQAILNSTDPRQIIDLRKKGFRMYEFLAWPDRWQADLMALDEAVNQLGDPALRVDAELEWIHFLIWHTRDAEAFERADRVLRQPNLNLIQHAWALEYRAYTLASQGRLDESDADRQEVIERLAGAPSQLRGRAMYGRLMNAYKRGDYPAALEWAARCREEFLASGASTHLINVYTMEGILTAISGDSSGAIRLLEQARNEARRIGQRTHQLAALFNLFELHMESGNLTEARAALSEAVEARPVFFEPFEEAAFVRYQSQLAWFTGELGQGISLAKHALELDEQANVMEHRLLGRLVLAGLHLELGDADSAKGLLKQTDQLMRESSIGFFRFTLGLKWAQLNLLHGQAQMALEHLTNLESLLPSARADEVVQRGVLTMCAHIALGDLQAARTMLESIPETHHLESQLRVLALRCRLDPDADTIRQVESRLASQNLPAMESLGLLHALMVTLNATDQGDFLARVHHELVERVNTLAASLEQHPPLKRSFLEQHQERADFSKNTMLNGVY